MILGLNISRDLMKKVLLAILSFVSFFMGISVYVHSMSLFLDKIGADQLPIVMVAGAVLVIIYSAANTLMANKMTAARTFGITTVFITLLYIGIFFMRDYEYWQIISFFVITGFVYVFFEFIIANFASSIVTPIQAKSVLPIVYGFSSLGTIVGSYFAVQIQEVHQALGIGVVPIIGLLIILVLIGIMSVLYKKDLHFSIQKESEQVSGLTDLKNTVRYIFKESKMFKLLAYTTVILVVVQRLAEFKFKTVLSFDYHGEDLTQVFGTVYIIDSAIAFFINIFLAKKLLFKYGVGNLMILFPFLLLTFLAVTVFTGMESIGIIAFYLAFSIPMHSYIPVASTQIFSVAPRKINQSVFFTIRGVIVAITALVVSATLIIYTYWLELEKTLNTAVIFIFIILMILIMFKLKKSYFSTIKDNLYKEDEYLKHRSIELFAEKANRYKGITYLRRVLQLSRTKGETKLKTINCLGIIGSYDSLIDLINVLNSDNPKEIFAALHAIKAIITNKKVLNRYPVTKHLLLSAYRNLFISNIPAFIKLEVISSLKYFDLEDIISFLEEHLKSEDPSLKINIIETLGSFNDRGIVKYVQPYVQSENPRLSSAAIAALWQFVDIRPYMIAQVAKVLSENTESAIDSALYLIGATNAKWERRFVLQKSISENPHTKVHAALTFLTLGELKYIKNFIRETLEFLKKDDKFEIDFILSRYRKLDNKTKKLIITQIQNLEVKDVRLFQKAFEESKYVFETEESELSNK